MSSPLSNPVRDAKAGAESYIRALLDLLGEQDPLVVQAKTSTRLIESLAAISERDALVPEGPGKWCVMQVLHHLVDTEIVTGYRVRLIVAQEEPKIQAYDQDAWANRLRYDEGEIPQLLQEHRVLRGRNLRLAHSLLPHEWDRCGIHEERGRESVDRLVRLVAGHDLVHLNQIERIKRTLGLV